MKRIIVLLSVLSCILFASAQSANGRYVSRMTQDGMLYFIEPKKLSKVDNIQRFEYDVTLTSWTDSATINFTFKSKSVDYPESLCIKSCGEEHKVVNYSLLFTDIVKSGYEIRVTSKIGVDMLEQMFSCPNPPVFVFLQNGVACTASYKPGAWNSDRKKLIDIYNLYKLRK